MNSQVLEATASTPVSGAHASRRLLAVHDTAALVLLTPCVLLIHGYHPFADDAGIYVAGIRKMLDPSLFTVDSAFVTAHTRWSVFSHIFAGILRLTHLPLEIGLLAAYLLSIFAFLLGSLRLAQRIFHDVHLQWGATLFAGVLFTLPVAATALWLMDPYVTARSFSTPLSLFALSACLGREWKRMTLWFLVVVALHPLMAVYLGAFLAACILVMQQRWRWIAAACMVTFAGSAALYLATRHQLLPYGYREAVLTRNYFFLSNWHWYELTGLIAPLLLMLAAAIRTRNSSVRALCLASIVTGAAATAIVACFVHPSGSFLLARIQPLRSFQMIYAVGVILLGGFLAEHLRGRRALLGAVLLALIAGGMLLSQEQVYAASAHVEWPFAAPRNPWQQAFLWIRRNTPKDAVFAVDPENENLPASDMQGFRATAARSVLVDEMKDGGVVAIFPQLAPQWKAQRDLETGLDQMTDLQRIARLRPAGVTWLLLNSNAPTQMNCPYRNQSVKVCQLP